MVDLGRNPGCDRNARVFPGVDGVGSAFLWTAASDRNVATIIPRRRPAAGDMPGFPAPRGKKNGAKTKANIIIRNILERQRMSKL